MIVFLALLAGGCGSPDPRAMQGPRAVEMDSSAEFHQVIDQSDKPVLMLFFKEHCDSCAALEPQIDRLAGEYQGRALVARIMILNSPYNGPNRVIKEQNKISSVPTVILFVHGREKRRWVADFNMDHYRSALNAAVADSPGGSTAR